MRTDFRKPTLRISLPAGSVKPVRKAGKVVKDRHGWPVQRSTVGF